MALKSNQAIHQQELKHTEKPSQYFMEHKPQKSLLITRNNFSNLIPSLSPHQDEGPCSLKPNTLPKPDCVNVLLRVYLNAVRDSLIWNC